MIIEVQAERTYPVIIDTAWKVELSKLLVGRNKAAIIVSEKMQASIKDLIATDAEVLIFPIPDGEPGKSSATLNKIWDWLGAAGFTRSDLIIAIGGGAVTDLAGFAAASWLRGIDWVAIPTTVAGAVDAAIGGKTAINSEYGKNLIGAFYSPSAVIIDVSWFDSLSDRDFAAGLAEVVKAGFISDAKILQLISDSKILDLRSNRAAVIELVSRAIAVKAEIVSSDFKENFGREVLNYGHTLGHAIELHCKYDLRHGECVSIGMAFMAQLQLSLGLISSELAQQHIDILKNLGLPTTYKRQAWPSLLSSMYLDKKSRGKTLRLVTIKGIGITDRLENPDEKILLAAYEKVSL
ncbi:MAG: 3-dehydroquinate synthase [Candidatus Planktophila sp.]|nr:3-dehydroquinate synthase [Candidatus Planktophila sp.]